VKLLLDENLSPLQAQILRAGGHDAMSVVEMGLSGTDDPVVRATAIETDRVLVNATSTKTIRSRPFSFR
jgi:predicted nuclease of predicted toxin-antitoxin system